ncbi:unnamed protein product, partial [Amoebophrya sp. A25]
SSSSSSSFERSKNKDNGLSRGSEQGSDHSTRRGDKAGRYSYWSQIDTGFENITKRWRLIVSASGATAVVTGMLLFFYSTETQDFLYKSGGNYNESESTRSSDASNSSPTNEQQELDGRHLLFSNHTTAEGVTNRGLSFHEREASKAFLQQGEHTGVQLNSKAPGRVFVSCLSKAATETEVMN